MQHKNIILFWIDSLAAGEFQRLSAKGKLPNLQRFSEGAVNFTNAFSISSTTSVCTASVLTGRYPMGHGIRALNGYRLADEVETLPQILQQHGYSTAARMTGPLSPVVGLDRGFDDYQWRKQDENLYGGLMDDVCHFIRHNAEGAPWFLFLHLWETHAPYWLPELGGKQTTLDKLHKQQRYERALQSLDAYLGQIFAEINFETTIAVVTGDHGEIIGNFRQRWKARQQRKQRIPVLDERFVHLAHASHVYDKMIHVPLMIRADNLLTANNHTEIVRQIDIAPTIAQLSNARWPSPIDGCALFDDTLAFVPPPQEVLLDANGMIPLGTENWLVGLRTNAWKYVVAPEATDSYSKLYDLRADPQENTDVSDANETVVQQMQQQIVDLLGQPLNQLTFPAPTLQGSDADALQQRLQALGYL